MSEARFNTPEHTIFDHHIVVLAGDGCLQEGISQEAAALAAHLQLDNLILFYDSNNVTLDAMAPVTQSEDTGARFKAYGWDAGFLTFVVASVLGIVLFAFLWKAPPDGYAEK